VFREWHPVAQNNRMPFFYVAKKQHFFLAILTILAMFLKMFSVLIGFIGILEMVLGIR
jgi:hypothetical protein